MRVRQLIGGSAAGWVGSGGRKRRRFISRTTRKCWNGTVPWSRVGRSVRVRAPMSVRGHACVRVPRVDDAGPKSAEGLVMRDGGPSANGSAFRSIRLNVKTRNISRRFFLSSILPPPLHENSSSSFLKRTRPPRRKGRASARRSRDEENGGSKPRIEPDPETRLFRFRGNIIYTIRSNKKNPTPNSPPARSWSLHRVSSSNILIPRSEFRVFILDAITIIQISMIYTRSPTVS